MTGGSTLALVAGRIFGLAELSMLGAAGFALVAGASATTGLTLAGLTAERTLRPVRLTVGVPGSVVWQIHNPTRRRWGGGQANEPFEGAPIVSRFAVGPIPPGGDRTQEYPLQPAQRGRFRLGPLEIARSDAFGLVRRGVVAGEATMVAVRPRIDTLAGAELPLGGGALPSGSTAAAGRPTARDGPGEDFSSLQDYRPGDDPRRVDWKTSARRNSLVLREYEVTDQDQTTVLLDRRWAVHTPQSFEDAVSAVASIVNACVRSERPVRLAAGPLTTVAGCGRSHLDAFLDLLVDIAPSDDRSPAADLGAVGDGGRVVLVTTTLGEAECRQWAARHRRRLSPITLVVFDLEGATHPTPGDPGVVRVGSDQSFAVTWEGVHRIGVAHGTGGGSDA